MDGKIILRTGIASDTFLLAITRLWDPPSPIYSGYREHFPQRKGG
jgi:hypothetical protein